MTRGWILFVITCACAAGQGTEPKEKAEAYPARITLGKVTFAAENWGHGFTSPQGAFALDDYIAVEVAVYSEGLQPVVLSAGNFTLRLNKKGVPLLAQSPGMVSASMKYPDWERQRELVGTVGSGDGDVIFGRRAPVERFPGDQRTRPPAGGIPRAPEPENPPGVQPQPKLKPEEIVMRAALPEGSHRPPVSGFLFFPYRGKMKSVKSFELLYEGPAGSAVLALP